MLRIHLPRQALEDRIGDLEGKRHSLKRVADDFPLRAGQLHRDLLSRRCGPLLRERGRDGKQQQCECEPHHQQCVTMPETTTIVAALTVPDPHATPAELPAVIDPDTFKDPATSSSAPGEVVPMPT